MNKAEIKEMLKELGNKAGEVAAEIEEKIEAEKAELDKETRQKVRKFWIAACVVSSLIGFTFSYIL